MDYPENVDSGRSNFQLDTRSSGRRSNLDYLQTRRTLSFLSQAERDHKQCNHLHKRSYEQSFAICARSLMGRIGGVSRPTSRSLARDGLFGRAPMAESFTWLHGVALAI